MKFFRRVLATLVFVLAPPLYAEVVDRVVAVVNHQPITFYQLNQKIAEGMDNVRQSLKRSQQELSESELRNLALRKLIDETLLEQEMTKEKIEATEDDVQKAISNVLARNQITREQLLVQISKGGQTYPQYLRELKKQLRRLKFMGQTIANKVKVTDKDLDDFFAQHAGQFGSFQSVKIAQIIVPVVEGASVEAIEAAQEKAQQVSEKARKGDNFEKLGKQYSDNPSTAIPDTFQVSQLSPAIAQALGSMNVNGVSDPIRSNLGFHVVKLYERSTLAGEENKALREQARERVFEIKIEAELQRYVDKLKEKSYIEIKNNS